MRIEYLPKNESVIRTVATWIYNEWLQDNPSASIERMVNLLNERAESTIVPLSLVAFNANGIPVGVGSLTIADMKTHTDLTPWLSGVYVAPEERSRGVGAALCKGIGEEARRLGYPRAYLFTKDRQSFYSKLGWQRLFDEQYFGSEVTVMALELSE